MILVGYVWLQDVCRPAQVRPGSSNAKAGLKDQPSMLQFRAFAFSSCVCVWGCADLSLSLCESLAPNVLERIVCVCVLVHSF